MPTVKGLKKLAKERCLHGYSKLRKAELLSLLEKPIPAPRRDFSERLPALKRNFSERLPASKNPSINVPILQSEIVVVKKDKAPSFIEKTTETVLGWMNWLAESGQKYIIKPITSTLKNIKKNQQNI